MNELLKEIERLYGEDLYRTLHDGVFTQLRNFERNELKTSLQSLSNEKEELETKLNSNDLESVYPVKNNQTFDMDIEQDLKNENEAIDKRLSEIDNEINTLNARKKQLDSDILSFSNALEILREQQSFINQTRFPEVFNRNALLINYYDDQIDKKTAEVNSIPNKLAELEKETGSITQQKQNNMDLSRTIRNSSNVQLDFEAMGKDADRLEQINKMIDSYNEKNDAYNNAIRNISNISFDPDAANKVSIINELISTNTLKSERDELVAKIAFLSNKTNYDISNNKDFDESKDYKANYVATVENLEELKNNLDHEIETLESEIAASMDDSNKVSELLTKKAELIKQKADLELAAGITKTGKKVYLNHLREKDIEEMRQLLSQLNNIDDKISRLNQIKIITNDIVNNQNMFAQPAPVQQPVVNSEPIISEQTTATANPSDLGDESAVIVEQPVKKGTTYVPPFSDLDFSVSDNSDPTREQDDEENEFEDDIAPSMYTQQSENRFSRFNPHNSGNRSDVSEIPVSFEDRMRAMPPEEHFEKQSGDDLDRSNFGFRRRFGPSTYSDPIPMPGKTDEQELFPSKPTDIPPWEDEYTLKPIGFGQFFDADEDEFEDDNVRGMYVNPSENSNPHNGENNSDVTNFAYEPYTPYRDRTKAQSESIAPETTNSQLNDVEPQSEDEFDIMSMFGNPNANNTVDEDDEELPPPIIFPDEDDEDLSSDMNRSNPILDERQHGELGQQNSEDSVDKESEDDSEKKSENRESFRRPRPRPQPRFSDDNYGEEQRTPFIRLNNNFSDDDYEKEYDPNFSYVPESRFKNFKELPSKFVNFASRTWSNAVDLKDEVVDGLIDLKDEMVDKFDERFNHGRSK